MATHTPAPWHTKYHAFQDGTGGDKFFTLHGPRRAHMGKLPAWTDEDEYNARLIAEAPATLAALEAAERALTTCADWLRSQGQHRADTAKHWAIEAQAAISRARSEV